MDILTYLMAKNSQNTGKDLFSYLLGKNAGESGTYTTFSGTSLNISNTIKAAIKKFMLNSTELTQTGTPTPDTPKDIHVITGSNNIKISDGTQEQNYPIDLRSDNLFNKNAGFTNGYIDNSGNLIVALNNALIKGYIKVKPNTTYIISQDISIYSIGICLYNETTFIGRIPQILDTNHRTFTTNENTNQIRLFINLDNQTPMTQTIIDTLNIRLNEGNVIKPYTPYYNIEYCKIGDYADQFFKNTTDSEFYDSTLELNEWYLKKNISKVALNGSENWQERTNSAHVKQFYAPSGSQTLINVKQISNYFSKFNGSLFNWGGVGDFAILSQTKEFYVCVSDDITLEDFKSKLPIENLIVYYVLATPQYIHISETDYPTLRSQLENIYNNAKSYNGTTNITQTNEDLPFNISVDVKVKTL